MSGTVAAHPDERERDYSASCIKSNPSLALCRQPVVKCVLLSSMFPAYHKMSAVEQHVSCLSDNVYWWAA